MNNPTNDLTAFSHRELEIAGKLLQLFANTSPAFLGDGVQVWFNTNSGYVFLCDEDFNVGILNSEDSKIIQFFSCPECGEEGTEEDETICTSCGYCKKHCQCEKVE